MDVEAQYGTFEQKTKTHTMPDLQRGILRAGNQPIAPANTPGIDIAMSPLADEDIDHASISSEGSQDSAQAGVKRLEAISSTWTRTSLFIAYFGYVCGNSLHQEVRI